MARSVRIVAMADTHSEHAALEVPDGDVLIHAGDLTQRGGLDELAAVASWLRGLPHPHKVVIAGNHDFALERKPQEARALFHGLHYLQDQEVTCAGLRIYGAPWQPWFHSWAFNVHRGAPIDAKWALIPTGLDVLVTHGPPKGYGDTVYDGERVGCEELLRHALQKRPRLHLFGHIHEDKGSWVEGSVRFVNVTTAECTLPVTTLELEMS